MKLLPVAAAIMAAVVVVVLRAQASPAPADGAGPAGWGIAPDETDQTNNVFENVLTTMNPADVFSPSVAPDLAARNLRACLDAIAYSEGTAGRGDDGYNVLFGGSTFDDYSDHPRQYFPFTDRNGVSRKTSAAGRYQFIVPTWDSLATRLGLTDFGPESQDAAACELIRQKGAMADAQAGRFASFVDKCRRIWASLPGANYAQPERSFSSLLAAYARAGGTLES